MAYSTINKPSEYFNTVLYTGNATGRTISGVGFQPDWTWIKNRSDISGHRVLDAVRGGTKELIANGTNAEITEAQSLQSWNSDGFVLGTAAGVNANTDNFVAWNWLADNTSGSSNTDGSITSTVAANTTAGFSIVTWSGTGANGTVGHGLSSAPKFIVVKRRDSATTNWVAWHQGLTSGDYFINFNLTDAQASNSVVWNSTIPTSSVFSVGTNIYTNPSGGSQIAYCFSEVKGYSKMGSYTGNGSLDAPFLYCGFKPALLIIKRTNGANNWTLFDNKINPYNEMQTTLYPNLSNAQDTATDYDDADFVSNGVKLREDNDNINASGGSYIYMAWAEQTLVGTNNVCATAR